MYLSFSGFKLFTGCAFAYWNSYINKTLPETPEDRLGSVYGSIVGRIFEIFYTLKGWRKPDPQKYLESFVDEVTSEVLNSEMTPRNGRPAGVLIWKGPQSEGKNPKALYGSEEDLKADVRDTIPRGLRIIRHHRLLGPRPMAEEKLDLDLEGHKIAGRADFIINRATPVNDLVLIDGKGSRHRDSYVDPRQLYWYAMLFWLRSMKSGKPRIPNKLGFLYWRFEPDESVDWHEPTERDLKELYDHTMSTVREIESLKKQLLPNGDPDGARGVFKPEAKEKNCRFCLFAHVCPPGAKVQADLKKKRK